MTGAQVGSMKWMAPEVMDDEQKSDSYAADRYSMGVRLRCDFFSSIAAGSHCCCLSCFQIIAWEVITLDELYPKMGVMNILNGVLHRQMRPPTANMNSKFRLLCEVR